MTLKLFVFCTIPLIYAISVNAQNVSAPKWDEYRSPSAGDFLRAKKLSDKFNETWTYQFTLDNGTKAYINYATLYIPGSGEKIGCDLSFWNFKGKSYSVGRQYPPERLKEDRTKRTLNIKDEYFMNGTPGKGHHVFFSADKGGKFLVDLTFESAVASLIPGSGVWKIGSEKYAQYILIPYGRVSGKIAHDGDTLSVKGYGYMEHTWQTAQATDIAVRSLNFSANSAKKFYAGRIGFTKGGTPFGYAILADSGKTKIVVPKSVTDNGQAYTGKTFPKGNVGITWREGDAESLTFDMGHPQQKFSILNNFDGWIAQKAIKLMMGGEVFFYRGRSQGPDGSKLDWSVTGMQD